MCFHNMVTCILFRNINFYHPYTFFQGGLFGAKPGGFGTTTTASGGLFGQQTGGGLFSKPAGTTGFGGFGQTGAAPAFGKS